MRYRGDRIMPDPIYANTVAPNAVTKEWQDPNAATGEGRMYQTKNGRLFEGGPCITQTTHRVMQYGYVADRVRSVHGTPGVKT